MKIEGLPSLDKAFQALGKTVGGKVLRKSVTEATKPTLRKIRSRAPVGDRAHRTINGRLVAPGFLSRNIKQRGKLYKGVRASSTIGVTHEAFYGVAFLDDNGFENKRGYKRTPWFKKSFEEDENAMIDGVGDALKERILRIKAK